MDTETVLEVIAMLDTTIAKLRKEFDNPSSNEYELGFYLQGQIVGFDYFREHLQEAIEAQVNQAENELQGSE